MFWLAELLSSGEAVAWSGANGGAASVGTVEVEELIIFIPPFLQTNLTSVVTDKLPERELPAVITDELRPYVDQDTAENAARLSDYERFTSRQQIHLAHAGTFSRVTISGHNVSWSPQSRR
jgi:hypothetical protein